MKQHIDNVLAFQGPIFLVNIGESIIDYVPFKEIATSRPEYTAFRNVLKPGMIVASDGDARFSYTHGVPVDISTKETVRYAMVVRFPLLHRHKKTCKLTEDYVFSDSEDWPCFSDMDEFMLEN